MSENIQKSRGTTNAYKAGAGGVPFDAGPHIGIVKNNIDPTRTGKIQVYIEKFSGPEENNAQFWKEVSYMSPFFGQTSPVIPASKDNLGSFVQNPHSYGMWFTPPDIGTKVVCVFAGGDPNQGYYIGCVVDPDAHHMLPAIGSTSNFLPSSSPYFSNVSRLPTVEINAENTAADGPQFFNLSKPIHQVQAFALLQQGLINDPVRGTINSNSYRETPSTVFGISTPGRPIYGGASDEAEYQEKLAQDSANPGSVPVEQFSIVGRKGGHSIVMDDGDSSANDQHIRIRTAKGHQIMLSDTGESIHVIHANGQSWFEMGKEGTIDFYASNSINFRSADVNFYADRLIGLNAKAGMNLVSDGIMNVESKTLQVSGDDAILMYSKKYIGIKSDENLSLQNIGTSTWRGGKTMILDAGCINLNGPQAPEVPNTTKLTKNKLPDVKWTNDVGWEVEENAIETTVLRVPTHEPYPFHGGGTSAVVSLETASVNAPLAPSVQSAIDQTDNLTQNTITDYEFEAQAEAKSSIGTLSKQQVTGMLAQDSLNIGQTADTLSSALGVGKYGLSPAELERAGFLKPGTTEFYLNSSADVATILQSPVVWSGKEGVENVATILADTKLQDSIKVDLYQKGLNELKNTGIITGQENPSDIGGLVSAASKYTGKTVTQWVNNDPSVAGDSTDIGLKVSGSKYAVNLVDQKLTTTKQGFSTVTNSPGGTTLRTQVDQSAESVITETKISGGSTTTVYTPTPPNAQQLSIQKQIDYINQNELPQARSQYLANNPGANNGDWLRSAEFRSIIQRRDAFNQQYVEAGLRE